MRESSQEQKVRGSEAGRETSYTTCLRAAENHGGCFGNVFSAPKEMGLDQLSLR